MKLFRILNAWAVRPSCWLIATLIIVVGIGGIKKTVYETYHPDHFIVVADGQSYNCARYDMAKLPVCSISVDDRGATTIIMTPTYFVTLYDRKPGQWFSTVASEFNCKTFHVYSVK